jgi:hypothetical protein
MKRPAQVGFAVFVIAVLILSAYAAIAFSTLSLSKVDFQSNDPALNKSSWLLTVVEDGNSQYATGTFDNEQIKSPDGRYAQQDLKIEIENTKNTCEYTFQNTAIPIYTVDQRKLDGVLAWYNTPDKCKALYSGTFTSANPGFSGYCFVRTQSGTVAPLSTPVTTVASTVKLTAGGTPATGTVGSISQKSVALADNSGKTRAIATWNGNLVSGEQCPNPLDAGVTGVKDSSGFLISTKAAYDAYITDASQDNLKNCLGLISFSEPTLEGHYKACLDSYNARSRALLTKTATKPFQNATLMKNSTGAGKATISLPNLIQYPVLTLRVDATWLGIFLPVTKPEIVKLEAAEFTEGSSGNVRATIKNAGNVNGSISITLACTGSIERTGILRTLSLNAGTTGTVDLPISCQADGTASQGSCTVTAADISKPDNKDTKSVSTLCKPIALCNANEQRCSDNTVQTCNSQGTKWVNEQVCPSGCTIQDGKPTCVTLESCTKASDCDDNDDTTVDSCVGVVEKTCKHVPVPASSGSSIPLKLLGFGIALVLFGIVTYFLATNGLIYPAIGTGLLTIACLVGVLLGVFATFSLLSAWILTIALVLLLVGMGGLEFFPEIAVFCFILAAALFVVGVMLFYTCTDPGPFLTWAGVCS